MSINLFQPYRIGKLELRNRFVRSPIGDTTADDNGDVTVIDCFGNVVYKRGSITVRSASGRYDMTNKRFTFGGPDDR